MKSMTGYGRYSVEKEGRMLIIELKSVNHRFLDLNIKLPRVHNFAESTIRKVLSDKLTRGHVDVFVNYTDNREKKYSLEVDGMLAKSYIEIADSLSSKYNIINDFTVSSLLKSPDVVSEVPVEDDEVVINSMYDECIEGSLNALNEMREKEGEQIKVDLTSRINTLLESLERVKRRAPEVFADYKVKLKARIQEALIDVAIDEARLLNEVAFFADKGAIDEEVTRLKVHFDNFLELLSEEPAGKKMDFLVQEMNRETNTIGSKANDIILVNEVLNMKAEIEKIREQIQNIE